MGTKIQFDRHALSRLEQRSREFGICFETAKELAIATARKGKPARKHKTYCCYFNNELNLTVYVSCREAHCGDQKFVQIKTIIIEEGRE